MKIGIRREKVTDAGVIHGEFIQIEAQLSRLHNQLTMVATGEDAKSLYSLASSDPVFNGEESLDSLSYWSVDFLHSSEPTFFRLYGFEKRKDGSVLIRMDRAYPTGVAPIPEPIASY